MCERLVSRLGGRGFRVAWLKRTHHAVDAPGKSSDRVWLARPSATMLRAADRLAITLPVCSDEASDMLEALPGDFDVVLFETHQPLEFPTLLSWSASVQPGEQVFGRWSLYAEDAAAAESAQAIEAMLPADRELDGAMRAALRLHGGHGCAGLVLGTRLALLGAAALGVDVPDNKKRLIVVSETDRCAVDGIQAVTGCRPGKRTLRLLDYGKLAATFLDEYSGRAVRVAVRGDLRERVNASGPERHELQRAAYASWAPEELFTLEESAFSLDQNDRPGPPRIRIRCARCGEEVSDGRHLETELGRQCRPCAAAAAPEGVFA